MSKKQQLCWRSVNVPVGQRVGVAQAFSTPKPAKFSATGMQVHTAPNKKEFVIVGELASINNQYVQHCWQFDKSDPLGKYGFEVQIGHYVFKNLHFEVTK